MKVRCFAAAVLAALAACSGYGDPAPVTVMIAGTVRAEGSLAPVSGARVILADRRSSYDMAYTIASALTISTGQYEITAQAYRPGYSGCDFLLAYVEGYEYVATSAVACNSNRQVIDFVLPP